MASTAEHFRQAEQHVRARRHDAAIAIYETILQNNPGDARARYRIAVVQLMRGRYAEGEALLRECLHDQPNDPDILFSLGRACAAQGHYEASIEALGMARAHAPDRADVAAALADAHYLSGDLEAAVAIYQVASTMAPGDLRIQINLCNALSRSENHDQAIDVMREIYSKSGKHPEAALSFANILRAAGQLDEALDLTNAVLSNTPDNVDALACQAELIDRLGDNEASVKLLAPLLDTRPVPHSLARAFGQVATNQSRDGLPLAKVISLIESFLATPGRNRLDRRGLLFMLANLKHRAGEIDAAFEACLQANAAAAVAYRPADVDKRFAAYQAVYTHETLNRLPRSANDSRRPLFIVGMPRSGTTLVEQILDSHPEVTAAGELSEIPIATRTMPGYPNILTSLPAATLDEIAQSYLKRLDAESATSRYVTDKMPINFEHLGFIGQLFPDARVVHCRRHPLGTALSCLFQNFRTHNEFAFSLDSFAHYYSHYAKLMDHWSKCLSLPVFELRYEELVADPQTLIGALLEFCDLPWDDACLAFDKNERFVNTLSYAQVRQPLTTEPTARHRKYEAQLAPLAAALSDEIARYEAGD